MYTFFSEQMMLLSDSTLFRYIISQFFDENINNKINSKSQQQTQNK